MFSVFVTKDLNLPWIIFNSMIKCFFLNYDKKHRLGIGNKFLIL